MGRIYIGGYKICEILNHEGFYVFNINDEKFNKIKQSVSDYISLELLNDNDEFLFYALSNFCENRGYNIYELRLSEELHRYTEPVGIKFYSKFVEPNSSFNDLKWDKLNNIYTKQEKSIFESLWSDLEREVNYFSSDYSSIKYLNKSNDNLDFLNKFENLLVKYQEYWDELSILSPYQIINKKIEILDLEKLSTYVANRKNDLVNVKEYKRLYEKLVIEIDKYKRTPQ